MKDLSNTILSWLFEELQKRDANLIPLRLFIGLGWIRAGVEKLVDPHWYSGDTLIEFLRGHVMSGEVAFPIYSGLMMGPFTEYASFLSNLVTVGQLYAGIAIFFGFLTRPALLVGIFMNLNFILAGAVSPSAFYVIIQLALLTSNIRRVMGIDSLLRSILGPQLYLRAQEKKIVVERFKVRFFFSGCLCGLTLMLVVAPYIRTLDPAKSIEDPAMLLVILLGLQNVLFLTLGLQAVARQRELTMHFPPAVRMPNPAADLPVQTEPIVQSQDEYVYLGGANLLY